MAVSENHFSLSAEIIFCGQRKSFFAVSENQFLAVSENHFWLSAKIFFGCQRKSFFAVSENLFLLSAEIFFCFQRKTFFAVSKQLFLLAFNAGSDEIRYVESMNAVYITHLKNSAFILLTTKEAWSEVHALGRGHFRIESVYLDMDN